MTRNSEPPRPSTSSVTGSRHAPSQGATNGRATPERPSPEAALTLARRTFAAGERIEMRTLASELGIGRSTLYRWFGDRDRLIGEMIWRLLEDTITAAEQQVDEAGRVGAGRILAVIARTNREVAASRPLRRFLTAEPEAALRVLTTKHGDVQPRVVRYIADTIRAERQREPLKPAIDATALAYAIVRISEGFLYADQITDTPVDLDMADAVMEALLQ